jgi:hypothetical protein
MKNTLFLLLATLCFACDFNNTDTTDVTTESTAIEEVVDEKIVIAQYQSAAVYPAHVEYEFVDKAGNSILVKEDTYDYASDPDMEVSEDDIPLELPPRMLEDETWLGEDESFPTSNPALIGQSFKLYYNQEGYIYKVEKEKEISITRMIYNSAAVYPMHTTYEFLDMEGENILFNVSEEENARAVEIPDNLLEEDEDLEGLPGENPELVGKAFDLHFDKENRVVKVELVDN